MLGPPRPEFAQRDGVHLAYQVAGSGPPDLVFVAGSYSTTMAWEEHAVARGFRRLASFSRLVTYDQRGMGYSDPLDLSHVPTLDDLVADLEVVLDAAGVQDPVLFGMHNGGAVAAVYASRHPVQRLVLCNTWARLEHADDYPIGFSRLVLDQLESRYRESWGEGRISNYWARPRPEVENRRIELGSTSRNQAVVLFQMNRDYDIRDVLPGVTAPTLVVHLEDNQMVPPHFGRYVADAIPGARLALVPGSDQIFLRNNFDEVIDAVEPFVTGTRRLFVDRVVTTMLFTDIVDSTPMAAALGDERWNALIEQHNNRLRKQLRKWRGVEVKCTGDGFLLAFDEPEAAIRCAMAAVEAIAGLGLELRAGVHVGEVSPMSSHDVSGLAVHFAQRLSAQASAGQVLVSADVRGRVRLERPSVRGARQGRVQGLRGRVGDIRGLPVGAGSSDAAAVRDPS